MLKIKFLLFSFNIQDSMLPLFHIVVSVSDHTQVSCSLCTPDLLLSPPPDTSPGAPGHTVSWPPPCTWAPPPPRTPAGGWSCTSSSPSPRTSPCTVADTPAPPEHDTPPALWSHISEPPPAVARIYTSSSLQFYTLLLEAAAQYQHKSPETGEYDDCL